AERMVIGYSSQTNQRKNCTKSKFFESQDIQNKIQPFNNRSFGHFENCIAQFLIGCHHLLMSKKYFVPVLFAFGIGGINFFPRRKDENILVIWILNLYRLN